VTRESERRSSIWMSVWDRSKLERVLERRLGWEEREGGERRRIRWALPFVALEGVWKGMSGVVSRVTEGAMLVV